MFTDHVRCHAHRWLTVYKAALGTGGLQAKLRTPLFTWGLVAIVAFDLLVAGAFCLRNRAYSLFFATHIICVIVSLIAVSFSRGD